MTVETEKKKMMYCGRRHCNRQLWREVMFCRKESERENPCESYIDLI